ncbi:porin [Phenylobacterium sp.]|uniref:porin n=1 Tax=Phenylobacterium sp. TaxID=1871053 RepID=UPI0011FA1955|nr:porin [Phenylobacterium sp.]THD61182.1 MAG: porin [Phenylobacterium sp.]
MTRCPLNTSMTLAACASLTLIASGLLASPALADGAAASTPAAASAASEASAKPAKTDDGNLTWKGITLYGTIDVGFAHLDHGAPLTSYYAPGLPFVIQKNSNRAITSISPNGLSQSKIGLSGAETINDDLKAVFKLETGFQPTSGHLSDGSRSLIVDNGVPLASQTTNGDSSRAGQLFQGAAYLGVSSKTYGALTYGLQTSLMVDNFAKYDPQNQSLAFSVIGYSGFAGGAGATETGRFDSSVKYVIAKGPVRAAYLHNFEGGINFPGRADQVDVGGDYRGVSVDLTYSHVDDAVTESPLSAAQNATAPGTLAGTVSDDTTYAIEARYVIGRAKIYGAVEAIDMANPSHPLPAGFRGIGGYVVSFVNNAAYSIHRKETVSWVGVRYAVTDKLDVTSAYYRYDQNSYKGNGCSDTSASSCSGSLWDASLVADYKLTKHFDAYAGLNHSAVANGLASGFLNRSSTAAPVIGVRFTF